MSIEQAVNAARAAGFKGEDLVTMVAIAGGESGFDASQITPEKPGGHSVGLWQIYTKVHPEWSDSQMKDPYQNAHAAKTLYNRRGGSLSPLRFTDWSAWKNGSYKGFISQAQSAVGESIPGADSKNGSLAKTTPCVDYKKCVQDAQDLIANNAFINMEAPKIEDLVLECRRKYLEANSGTANWKSNPKTDCYTTAEQASNVVQAKANAECAKCGVSNLSACISCAQTDAKAAGFHVLITLIIVAVIITGFYALTK